MEQPMVIAWAAAGALSLAVAGCAGPGYRCSQADVGTLLGGVAGGVLGSHVGRGHGQTAGIITGTLLGAVVGHEIGRSLDAADELRTREVLEENRTGQSSVWVNPDTGAQVAVTPTRTYQSDGEQYCREYSTQVMVGGERQQAYGTACRMPDGSWKVVD